MLLWLLKIHILSSKESESEIAQSCPTLCDLMNCSLPRYSIPGIFQARVLEWTQWVLLPGKFQGRRSLVGYSPWGDKKSDTTERFHFHFSLSCIGEGNGNPLQCSCLENPRDRGAWWADIYRVAQSQTRLKQLSSSSILKIKIWYYEANEYFVIQLLSHVWLCDPMNCSTTGFPVLHYLPEFAQTQVHWVSDVSFCLYWNNKNFSTVTWK